MVQVGKYYAGTSGLVLPVPNKSYYPQAFQDKSRLTYYGSLFNSLEVNSSFYKMPNAKTLVKWDGEVPANFKFTYKLLKDVTHNKQLLFNADDVGRFMAVINQSSKRGSLLIQLPPSTAVSTIGQLDALLAAVQVHNTQGNWDVAVEFRNNSWYLKETYELLNNYGATMVLHDMPASLSPIVSFDAGFIYLRFHGPTGNYRGGYEDDFLYEYAGYITDWLADGKTVYTYFNNTAGDAVHNLITLNKYVTDLSG
ncbi:DUF72 domain-containing protein [Mucilaginibacter pallidiroseus]|uniref:DUF72 domain-containing protein n=1 Tax=Mucilaginibacter pallidiroseus TaxID=2599295 RepID=A0A563UD50_9SPHI|nr:DUF72 domain-containing protein [Mucilaginibacter pallidiroseus]TWR29199.1 DUF72 domain-containing protein [Mucilaginibacter pallidiroseus]